MAESPEAWISLRRLMTTDGVSWQGLSHEEQVRARGITAPRRLRQFVAARRLAREVLTAGWGGMNSDWVLSAPADSPPSVISSPGRARPFIAISHSGDWLACAAANAPLGMDVEATERQRDVAALAQAICTDGELVLFNALDDQQREDRFYALWTLKEAWIKRHAEGATPGRMARIHASESASGDGGQALLWRARGVTLALVMKGVASPSKLLWAGSHPFGSTSPLRWSVHDLPTNDLIASPRGRDGLVDASASVIPDSDPGSVVP